MQLLGCDQRKTVDQVKPHLVAKHRFGASSSAVGFQHTMITDMPHKFKILTHGSVSYPILHPN